MGERGHEVIGSLRAVHVKRLERPGGSRAQLHDLLGHGALDAIQACLERLASRDLEVASIAGVHGTERVWLVLPSWEAYVALAFDELLVAGPSALQVARRLVDVLGELVDAVPPARRAPVEHRLQRAVGDLHRAFLDEAPVTS